MRLLLAAALVAAFSWAARAGESCVSPEDYTAAMAIVQPQAIVAETWWGDRGRAFVRAYNAAPPPTDHVADEALVFAMPRFRALPTVFFNQGCLVTRGVIPMEMYDVIRRKAMGARI